METVTKNRPKKGTDKEKMKMKKRLTELVFILDRSGSMERIRRATITHFNNLLKMQRANAYEDEEAVISIYEFNHTLEKICFRSPLDAAHDLTCETYVPMGRTALNDAVCSILNEITGAQKEELVEREKIVTVVCIITDGLENSSRFYRRADLKRLIAAKKEEGWNFVFAGANFDVDEEGEELGFDRRERISFEASDRGMCDLSERVCCCLSEYREPDRDEEELAQLRLRADNRKKGRDQK